MIFNKRRLRWIRFYIIVYLSLADIVTLLALLFIMMKSLIEDKLIESDLDDHFAIIMRAISFSAHIYSLTVFLAFDRYVAVKFSLKYENIMTEKRMICALTILSVLSTAISGIQWINVHDSLPLTCMLIGVWSWSLLEPMFLFCCLFIPFYTQAIRKRRIKIRAKEQYFGITKEKLDRLEKLKSSLSDSFKLYIVNVVILIMSVQQRLSFQTVILKLI